MMGSADALGTRRCDVAKRFLQTAMVVDDNARMAQDGVDQPSEEMVVPNRWTQAPSQDDQDAVDGGSIHTLDADSVMESFSALGVVCGVVGPTDSAMDAMRQADIVILDWLLQDGKPQCALRLLRNLVAGKVNRNLLRLVAIYTGEARLNDICAEVCKELTKAKLDPVEDEAKTTISYRHGRVVLYAKSAVNLEERLRHRSVAEENLPGKLVEDFASMTSGLLPGIALTSLTAVREGAHRVLDRFSAKLDPAFLSHRACLPNPDDAEQQIVNHVAEELRGLMDNAVAEEAPAGADAVERWIRRKGGGSGRFVFGTRNLDLDQTVALANKGLKASALKENKFECLSAGFSDDDGVELDERLAWIMSFRTVYDAPRPTLWLGSVVTDLSDKDERHLICMRPRCDCVRLEEEASFFFLPLVEPKKGKEQIVVRLDNTFKRLGINLDSAAWVRRQFKPSTQNGPVIAANRESDNGFEFTDTSGKRYVWRGELKAEYAQRIAYSLTVNLGRVALDESEWLRRMAKESR